MARYEAVVMCGCMEGIWGADILGRTRIYIQRRNNARNENKHIRRQIKPFAYGAPIRFKRNNFEQSINK